MSAQVTQFPPHNRRNPPQNRATPPEIRRARLADVRGLHALLERYSERGQLLPRSEADIYRHLREFFLLESGGRVIACAALQIFTRELGEVRSLAVDPSHTGRGLGRQLLGAVEREAAALGLTRLMALTYAEDFFREQGYHRVEMSELPEKVWGVCVNCPKFHHCDEIAVLKNLPPAQ